MVNVIAKQLSSIECDAADRLMVNQTNRKDKGRN